MDYPSITLPLIILESSTFFPHNILRLELSPHVARRVLGNSEGTKRLAIFTSIAKDAAISGGYIALGSGTKLCAIGCIAEISQVNRSYESDDKQYSLLLKGIQRCAFVKEDSNGLLLSTTKESPLTLPIITVKPYDLISDRNISPDHSRKLELVLKKSALLLWVMYPSLRAAHLNKVLGDGDTKATVLADLITQSLDDIAFLPDKLAILSATSEQDQITRTLALIHKFRPIDSIDRRTVGTSAAIGKPNAKNALTRGRIDTDDGDDDLQELRDKLSNAALSEMVVQVIKKELKRLSKMTSSSPEYSVGRTYVETLLDFPWQNPTHDTASSVIDINAVGKVLEEEHYGLHEIKSRILQYVAVMILQQEKHSPVPSTLVSTAIAPRRTNPTILCLVGPPGTGKTSLGKCIARSLGRRFERIALGGVYDEAELRGHRRTYIGALPGMIVQALRRAACLDPVILLDEIDKMGSRQTRNGMGDPQAALLEILDPDQNHSFKDHYIALPIDLSQIIFVATANYIDNISAPLLDRMEVIQLSGYTPQEKLLIAKKHLVQKQTEYAGLARISFTDDALVEMIGGYTREAGVRQLDREIAAICRHVAMEVVQGSAASRATVWTVDRQFVSTVLGAAKYSSDAALSHAPAGVVTGMAWTSTGGELLFVEAVSILPPTAFEEDHAAALGGISITGNIGRVMEESCQIALYWLRAHWMAAYNSLSKEGSIDLKVFKQRVFHSDIRVHMPGGAISKDGPSAGCAIVSALLSALSGVAVSPSVAMTGEVTLRGAVLPVGGIKEKVLAAARSSIRKVIMPLANKKDFEKLDFDGVGAIGVEYVETLEQLLQCLSAAMLSTCDISSAAMQPKGQSASHTVASWHVNNILRSQL